MSADTMNADTMSEEAMGSETELRFDGQTAIVTGSGGGLGREYALLLASRGAAVVVNDLNGDGAESVVEEIRSRGGKAIPSTRSVATVEGAADLVDEALSEFGSLEIVINNAGNLRDRSFPKMDLDAFQAVVAVHLEGCFNVVHAAWPHMRGQGYGRILNTSSNSGILGNFGQSNYGAAKAGVVGLTRVLAIEGAKYGIQVNAIAPYARTPMTQDLLAPEMREALDPARVAPAAVWVVHRDCDATGEVFSVGGGRVARYIQALTPGYVNANLTPELVRENWTHILDPEGYSIPRHSNDVLTELLARLKAADEVDVSQ